MRVLDQSKVNGRYSSAESSGISFEILSEGCLLASEVEIFLVGFAFFSDLVLLDFLGIRSCERSPDTIGADVEVSPFSECVGSTAEER